MAAVRVVRTEPRCSVGVWCADLYQGEVLTVGTETGQKTITQDIADYLTEHGVVVACADDATYDPWFVSREKGEDAPDPSELAVPSGHYTTNYTERPLVDADVGGGFIPTSLTAPPAEPVVMPPVEEPPAVPQEGA